MRIRVVLWALDDSIFVNTFQDSSDSSFMNDKFNLKEGPMSGNTPTSTNPNSAPQAPNPPKSNHHAKSRTHVPVDGYKIEGLRTTPLEKLVEIATELGIENPNELKRQDLMFEILKSQVNQGGFILFTGILEIASEGYGFLRATDANFSDSANDAYVSSTQVK